MKGRSGALGPLGRGRGLRQGTMGRVPDVLSQLPAHYWKVPYRGARRPGSAAVAARPGLADGANCQLFAYEVVARFGLAVPPLRSSDLWADREATAVVTTRPGPLDLVLYNATPDPYGAHVGVWTGDGSVLHLCREVGLPVVWTPADFASRERYRHLIGAKRVTARAGERSAGPSAGEGRQGA